MPGVIDKRSVSSIVPASTNEPELPQTLEDPLAEVARAATSGDRESVRRFLQAILPAVHRITRSVLGSEHPDFEDSVQESLLNALRALAQFRFEGTVHRYVTAIALRRALTTRRREATRWRKQESLDAHHETSVSAPDSRWSAEDIELVEKLLDNLSTVQGETLYMRIVLEYSIEEIARVTAVAPETVRTRLRRGKNTLRKQLVIPFWKRWFSKEAP